MNIYLFCFLLVCNVDQLVCVCICVYIHRYLHYYPVHMHYFTWFFSFTINILTYIHTIRFPFYYVIACIAISLLLNIWATFKF